jgi:hypothetical protein
MTPPHSINSLPPPVATPFSGSRHARSIVDTARFSRVDCCFTPFTGKSSLNNPENKIQVNNNDWLSEDIEKRDKEENVLVNTPESIAYLAQLPRTDRKRLLEQLEQVVDGEN